MMEANDFLKEKTAKLGIGQYSRHVLLCAGPRCCNAEDGEAAYEALKDQIKDHGLMSGPDAC